MGENKLLFYTALLGKLKKEVFYENETFRLAQKTMAQLFGVEMTAVSKHLANIFETSELNKEATVSRMEIVQVKIPDRFLKLSNYPVLKNKGRITMLEAKIKA